MKLALANADPVALNVERTWLAVAVLFAVLIARRGPLLPTDWRAVIVTGFFQTTLNFASTTMALAGGAPGRTSVLVFTMPFWTLLKAWPILGERVRGSQWIAIALALAGLTCSSRRGTGMGELAPRLWAVLTANGRLPSLRRSRAAKGTPGARARPNANNSYLQLDAVLLT
jgi:drug/metabolite transporter (DMT)-like permease